MHRFKITEDIHEREPFGKAKPGPNSVRKGTLVEAESRPTGRGFTLFHCRIVETGREIDTYACYVEETRESRREHMTPEERKKQDEWEEHERRQAWADYVRYRNGY